jgi:hypothetical protein
LNAQGAGIIPLMFGKSKPVEQMSHQLSFCVALNAIIPIENTAKRFFLLFAPHPREAF